MNEKLQKTMATAVAKASNALNKVEKLTKKSKQELHDLVTLMVQEAIAVSLQAVSVTSVTANANLVRNTLFPIDLIPVKSVLSSQTTQLVGLGMIIVAAQRMHNV